MAKIAIALDSNSGVTQKEAEKLGLYVLPMPFMIEDKVYYEERDLSHDEFYEILKEEYQNYKIINSIESQRYDYPTSDSGHHSFVSFGSNGFNYGIMS